MGISPQSLAKASSRHPWRVLAVWFVVVIAMGWVTQTYLSDALTNDIAFTNDPESIRAMELIERDVTGPQEDTEFFIVLSDSLTVRDPEFQAYVRELQGAIAELGDGVVADQPVSVYDLQAAAEQATGQQATELQQQAAGLVSRDEGGTLIVTPIVDVETETVEELKSVIHENERDGFEVLLAGPATLNSDSLEVAEEDLRKAEGIGLAIAFVVLLVVFGALIAALLPIGVALVAIPVALAGVALLGFVFEFSIFTQNMATMIGLAVGIDYSLFIVARYREERRKGFDKLESISITGGTASRAVFFSGLTVVLALLGMFLMPNTIFRSMATGAIFVVLVSIAAALTLLPAFLGKLGDRVNWPRITRRAKQTTDPDPRGGFWDRFTRTVMARPVVSLVLAVAVLGGLGAAYFTIEKGTTQSAATLPDEVESKRAFLILSERFAAGGRTDPVQIYVGGDLGSPAVQQAIAELQGAIAQSDAFADQAPVQPGPEGNAAVVQAIPVGDAFANETFDAVRSLRSDTIPQIFQGTDATALVGGMPAIFTDFLAQTDTYQPIVLAFVLGLSFLLLMVVFRSIVVPLKAVLMNLLSVGAAYGAIVIVFQRHEGGILGWLHELSLDVFNSIGFQFQEVEAIEAWLPLLLFSILFGLSMDYHVFLLSRIREHYDRTQDNTESVAYGLRTTAGIITGAALIMVAVFTAFAAGRLLPLQQMGFGLAVAVFMDATVVRSVLVPASMRLLGDLNWYLPSWLQWLPKLNVEGYGAEDHEREVELVAAAPGPSDGDGRAEPAVTPDRVGAEEGREGGS